jgi:sugar phosphate permease
MSAKVAAGVDVAKAKKMLTYRWVTYGMFLLTYIFVYFDRVAPAVVAPELMKEFGLSATALGILSSMYFYPYAAMQFPSGVLADKIGPRLSMSSFFIIAAIGTALFGMATTFGWCIFGRFLMGRGCMDAVYEDPVQLVPTE